MNDEKDEFVNTEEPIEVSDEERAMLIERIKSAEQGNVISHEEVMAYFDAMEEEVVAYKRAQALLKVGS